MLGNMIGMSGEGNRILSYHPLGRNEKRKKGVKDRQRMSATQKGRGYSVMALLVALPERKAALTILTTASKTRLAQLAQGRKAILPVATGKNA